MDHQLGRNTNGAHEVSLADLMDIARLTDTLPRRRALIGIEPAVVAWRDGLTPQVEAALPEILTRVRELMRRWDLETAHPVRQEG
jgi:hydrogenase maturation protease